MKLDGFGIFVKDMAAMIRFYKDVLNFEIREDENASNVYLVKDGTLFLLYRRADFENITCALAPRLGSRFQNRDCPF
jgi:catechol 2,3-dioxygenase-like lactoylglutathione lyase family enzyme